MKNLKYKDLNCELQSRFLIYFPHHIYIGRKSQNPTVGYLLKLLSKYLEKYQDRKYPYGDRKHLYKLMVDVYKFGKKEGKLISFYK